MGQYRLGEGLKEEVGGVEGEKKCGEGRGRERREETTEWGAFGGESPGREKDNEREG